MICVTMMGMEKTVADTISQFFSQGKEIRYGKGAIIVAADQEPEGVMWLTEGVVEQSALSREGVRVSVNVFKPPAFFPMSWAINRTDNAYFYSAASEVVLRLVSADEAVAFLRSQPEVVFDLLSRVYRGSDGLLQRLALAGTKVARDRLMFELLTECYRFGQQIDGDRWQIAVTQSALAGRSGLARETVSRELAKMAKLGWLETAKGVIKVEVERLERELRG